MNWIGLAALYFLSQQQRQQQRPAPAPRAPARELPDFARVRFEELALGEPVALEPGTTFLAQVELPAGLAFLVSEDAIRNAVEQGGQFVLISAHRGRPDFWPEPAEADWYITASYTGSERTTRALPELVKRAWRVV